MRTRLIALILASLIAGLSITAALAAPGPFFAWPRSDYPHGSALSFMNHATSMQVDCAVNYECTTGMSLSHSHQQDYFHRGDGDVQIAESNTRHGLMVWAATLQSYDTPENAAAALGDLIATTTITNPPELHFHEVAEPSVPAGFTVIKLKLYGPVNSITFLAAQSGTTEVELGVVYQNHDRAVATHFLNRQLSEAVSQMTEQAAP